MSASEVRGIWFDTARRYVVDTKGEEALVTLANRVDRGYREVLLEPDPTHWYPERVLQQALAAMHAVVANGNDEAFIDTIEECTRLGVNRFFRMMIRLGSPALILRRTPAMWGHIRRGRGEVSADAGDRRATIHFTSFPYFRDPHYRMLSVGAVKALVRMTGKDPRIEIASWEWDTLTINVAWD